MNRTNLVLMVENDLRLGESMQSHLEQALPIKILLARNLGEAHVLTYQYDFNAFVIDLVLPDGDGVEFACDIRTVMPQVPLVLLMDDRFHQLKIPVESLGQFDFLEKPVDILALREKLQALFPLSTEEDSFQGSLVKIRLVDLIQIKCFSGDSCQLAITGPEESGVITISRGKILYAWTPRLEGREAFNEMISWKRGYFHEGEMPGEIHSNIDGSWEGVLMDAVRLSDECYALEAV